MEQLESFGLPDTFPEFMMPAAGAQLVRDCLKVKGMRKQDLMRMAQSRGFRQTWKRLEHLGPGIYGFGLTINGCVVPLMVRMIERAVQCWHRRYRTNSSPFSEAGNQDGQRTEPEAAMASH